MNKMDIGFDDNKVERLFFESECKHLLLVIEPTLRLLRCKKCNELIEPLECLIEVACGKRKFRG